MKTLFLSLLLLAGCTATAPKETAQPQPEPGQRTYTEADLRKTGRPTVAEQFEAADPAVAPPGRSR